MSTTPTTNVWQTMWSEGRIGFHEAGGNHYLANYIDYLGHGRRVLVPLCGKTVDLAFLAARGHTVIGVEFVEAAARAFFAERNLVPTEIAATTESLLRLSAGAITIVVGDFFAVTTNDVGFIDAFYDRAAMIALPSDVRARYVEHLQSLVTFGAPGLLVTFEYDAALMNGPPFPVFESEVHARYGQERVQELAHHTLAHPRLSAAGGIGVERCYIVTR